MYKPIYDFSLKVLKSIKQIIFYFLHKFYL